MARLKVKGWGGVYSTPMLVGETVRSQDKGYKY